MKPRQIVQGECPECSMTIWKRDCDLDHVICPYCGASLPKSNQYSSEDANDGFFSNDGNQ
jgi:hypothetical protein